MKIRKKNENKEFAGKNVQKKMCEQNWFTIKHHREPHHEQ